MIEVVTKDWNVKPQSLLPGLETAGKLRKELAIAIVDKDKEKPMFLKFSRMNFD